MTARLAAEKLTDADVARLEDILTRARDTQDLTASSTLDSAFHQEIVVIARHKRLGRLWRDVGRTSSSGSPESTVAENRSGMRQATLTSHREMIEVLKTRKPDAARDLIEGHCGRKGFPDK